jgi:hypothetical protein
VSYLTWPQMPQCSYNLILTGTWHPYSCPDFAEQTGALGGGLGLPSPSCPQALSQFLELEPRFC